MKKLLRFISLSIVICYLNSCNQNDINPAGIDQVTFTLKQFTRLNDQSVTLNLKVMQPDSSILTAEKASVNRQEIILDETHGNGTYQVFVEVGLTNIFASDVGYEISYSVLPESVELDTDSSRSATGTMSGDELWYTVEKIDGKFRRPELVENGE